MLFAPLKIPDSIEDENTLTFGNIFKRLAVALKITHLLVSFLPILFFSSRRHTDTRINNRQTDRQRSKRPLRSDFTSQHGNSFWQRNNIAVDDVSKMGLSWTCRVFRKISVFSQFTATPPSPTSRRCKRPSKLWTQCECTVTPIGRSFFVQPIAGEYWRGRWQNFENTWKKNNI